jgi:hypothetical protein
MHIIQGAQVWRRIWAKLAATDWRPSRMRQSTAKPRRKQAPKRVLALPDLEQWMATICFWVTPESHRD